MNEPVVCLGECLVDRLFQRGQQRAGDWTDYPGGAPANVAAAIAKLGSPSRFVSCLGQDAVGDWLLQVLADQGVQCQVQRSAAPTRIVLVERDETGDRQFVGFSEPDPTAFADAHLTPSWVDRLDFDGVAYLVMGTLGLAYRETANAMKRARSRAQQQGVKLVIDLNWRPVFWPSDELAPAKIQDFIAATDLLKLSLEEAQWLWGTDSALEICQQLPQCQAVLLTDGGHGSTCATKNHTVSMPAFAVDSQDTTGAGDAFLAGAIHHLLVHGWDCLQQPKEIEEMLRYASAVGALTTLRPGAIAAQPSPQEVDAFLSRQPSPTR